MTDSIFDLFDFKISLGSWKEITKRLLGLIYAGDRASGLWFIDSFPFSHSKNIH